MFLIGKHLLPPGNLSGQSKMVCQAAHGVKRYLYLEKKRYNHVDQLDPDERSDHAAHPIDK